MRKNKKLLQLFFFTLGGLFGILVLIILFLYLYPVKTDSLVSHPRPSQSFEESLERIDILRKADPKEIALFGQTILIEREFPAFLLRRG